MVLIDNDADIIFLNGPIITVNSKNEIAEAVAIKGNKILYVGREKDVKKHIGNKTKIIDLKGRSLLPGFIDSHIHFGMLGMKQGPIIDIDYKKADSIEKIKELIRIDASKKEPGQWIICWGYDQNKLIESRHPTIEDLDDAAPFNPVRCTRCCGHMGVYNSMALKIGGIKDAGGFAPGEIVIINNKLTGLIKENAHMALGKKVSFTDEEIIEGILAADKLMVERGITTVHDAGSDGSKTFGLMEKETRAGIIKVRIHPMIFDLAGKESGNKLISNFIGTGLTSGFGNDHFSIGPVKIMLDGSSSGPSSATKKPYCHDSGLKGILVWTQEEVNDVICKAHNAGFQVTAHAIGDLAIEIIVNAIELALETNPRTDHRHRIEHCALPDLSLIKRIKMLGILPISNPGFIELNGKDYIRYYGDRVEYMFPLRSYLEEGITTAIASDSPVIECDPMLGIYGAINRIDGTSGEIVGVQQAIDIKEAIRMYTYNGAYASFEENIKGSIETGKLADLIILSENILNVSYDKVKRIQVDMTIIDGKIVYERR